MVIYDAELCGQLGCRKLAKHGGVHKERPEDAWDFLLPKDRAKVNKAGYATPRGGAKGAYQNHVYRNSKVIVPYERLAEVDLAQFKDGYVIRLLPNQYFASAGVPRSEFERPGSPQVGLDAFVLYRSHQALEKFPPVAGWHVRGLLKNGVAVDRRSQGVKDTGHYVLRLPNAGAGRPHTVAGPPQGIFAPEYADVEVNYLCKLVLVWLIVHTRRSPYVTSQALHIRSILRNASLLDHQQQEFSGVTRNGLSCCPLCLRTLDYTQLHDTVSFTAAAGLTNAGMQVEGATRSTEVNLFHLVPLVYGELQHAPSAIGWGHANCNTLLGQRRCYSLGELQDLDLKLGIVSEEGVHTIGWISEDYQMIRSPMGAVWVQLCGDMTEAELAGEVASVPAIAGDEALAEIAEGVGGD
ncbi:restriction endonuclease [Micromonospora sp. NPDC050980]|uniref:restriction endonuclease n=1 Tax=Micromonospora sp. NPDC050980 TaxID=3155161 RepID=UPI0033DBF363